METNALTTPPASAPIPQESPFASFIMIGFIFIIFYFLLLRPQQKKYKEHQAMVNAVQKNDKVILSSGIVGKVIKVEQEAGLVHVEIADNVIVKVVTSTLAKVESANKPINDNKK